MFAVVLMLGLLSDPLESGLASYAAGRPLDAIAPLRAALKADPSNARAQDVLAAALAETGHCEAAFAGLRTAVPRAADKTFRRALEIDGLRCGMTLNDPNATLAFLEMLNRDFPDDPEVLYMKVHAYSDLSIRASQDLVQKAPGSPQVHQLNAEALETQGKWEEAAAEYRIVLQRNPGLPGIHYRIGRLLLSAPKTDSTIAQARKEFEEELKINSNNAGAQYVLAELARQDQNWPDAIEHFAKATRLDAGFLDAYMGLGRSLIGAGRYTDAIAPLETAVKLQPQNPFTHFQLAIAYRHAGRKEDAERESALHRQLLDKSQKEKDETKRKVDGIDQPKQR